MSSTTDRTAQAEPEGGKADLVADFLASIVVFLVALPLCMGIAIASGAPPEAGLITGIIGGIIVGSIGGAAFQVSGPAAGLAVIVLDLITRYGLGVTASLVVVAGAIQLAAGGLKLGRWFRAVPPAVIHGMLSGIGVLILASQFHVMLDAKPIGTGLDNLVGIPYAIWDGLQPPYGEVHHQAALVGSLTIISLLMWARVAPKKISWVPAPLIAVIVGTGTASVLELGIRRIEMPAQLWTWGSLPGFENLAAVLTPGMLATAAAMAFIASAETLLTAAAVEKMRPGITTDYDKELAGQGVGNLLCGMLGGLPMTGVIVRSAANVEAGARTRRSTVMHGCWILAFTVVFPQVLELVPVSSLAAVLVYTGFKLTNLGIVKKLEKFSRLEVGIYAATVTTIVVKDLLAGVLVGLALGLLRLVVKSSSLHVRVVQEGTNEVIHLEGSATFVSLPRLAEALDSIKGENGDVVIKMDSLSVLDHACVELIESFEDRLERQGTNVQVPWEAAEQRHVDRGKVIPVSDPGPPPRAAMN